MMQHFKHNILNELMITYIMKADNVILQRGSKYDIAIGLGDNEH